MIFWRSFDNVTYKTKNGRFKSETFSFVDCSVKMISIAICHLKFKNISQHIRIYPVFFFFKVHFMSVSVFSRYMRGCLVVCVCKRTRFSETQVAEIMSACRSSISAWVCVGTLSSSPPNPLLGLQCQSISWCWLQSHPMGRHTYANAQTLLVSSHCESFTILPLHTDRNTLGPLGWQWGNGKQLLGGPSAPQQKNVAPRRHPLALS